MPPYGMVDYDPLRGYVHSDDLYWGYGGAKGRAADWQAQVVQQAHARRCSTRSPRSASTGPVDRPLGYPNHAERDQSPRCRTATGEAPIVSPNGRFVFFDLRDHAKQVRAELGAAGVAKLRAETLADLGH